MQIILFFKQALLNNNEDLQFIIFLFICSSLLKIFFISQGINLINLSMEEILFISNLPCEIKNIFRKLEQINKKIINCKSSLLFNSYNWK